MGKVLRTEKIAMATILRRIIPIKTAGLVSRKRVTVAADKSGIEKKVSEFRDVLGAPPQVLIDPTLEAINRYAAKVKSPKSAIRAKCVECVGGYLKEIATCTATKCALHPFRMGHNPFHKKAQARLGEVPSEEGDDDEDDTGLDPED